MKKTQKNRGGRPRLSSGQKQSEYLDVRLKSVEKRTFQDAADLSGLPLAAWVRERLRWAATKELEAAARPNALLEALDES